MQKTNDHYPSSGIYRHFLIFLTLVLLLSLSAVPARAQQGLDNYYTVNTVSLPDGKSIEKVMINSPPLPPPGFDIERRAVSLPVPSDAAGVTRLTVPAFNWVFGCSAVSGAMIAGYHDRSGWPDIYTGPTDGGVMPLNNSSWPTWSDGSATYPNCPLVASRNGVDGRTTRGSIDDYWVRYNSNADDPYITNGWTPHAWGDAIGDYMKTSQSAYGNVDGATAFYGWATLATPLTCSDMEQYNIHKEDGTYGRKLFYEARGYTVTDCYSQKTDNTVAGGFSFAQLKAEIDAGRPVMLNLAGHTVVGVGYDDVMNLVYLHDTWDYNVHSMTWGTSYSGMQLQSVSIVNLAPLNQTIHTVSFNSNGGSAVPDQLVPYNEKATRPADPTRAGYTFAGWYSDSELTTAFNFDTPITADITLYARWTATTGYQLTISVSPAGKGTVYPATGGWYPQGTAVTVGVTPGKNYIFSTWTGPVENVNNNPTTVTMTGPVTLIANLTLKPVLTPSITARTGSINGIREWTISLANSGKGPATNTRLVGLTLSQTSGPACTPSPVITSSFPLAYGDIPVGASVKKAVTINFSGCGDSARFSATASYEANGGVRGSKVFRNQTQ